MNQAQEACKNVAGTVRRYYTLVQLIKTILNFPFAFENPCNKNFVSTEIANIKKDTKASDLLTRMSSQSCYQYVLSGKNG